MYLVPELSPFMVKETVTQISNHQVPIVSAAQRTSTCQRRKQEDINTSGAEEWHLLAYPMQSIRGERSYYKTSCMQGPMSWPGFRAEGSGYIGSAQQRPLHRGEEAACFMTVVNTCRETHPLSEMEVKSICSARERERHTRCIMVTKGWMKQYFCIPSSWKGQCVLKIISN